MSDYNIADHYPEETSQPCAECGETDDCFIDEDTCESICSSCFNDKWDQ